MKNTKWMRDNFFAHRGLHTTEIPENTMRAFQNAINHGFHLELDIKLTKDNKIIVIHDNNLQRLCNVNINVEESLYDDIKDLQIKNTNQTIPLLKDVLNSIPQSTTLLIELKRNNNFKTLVKLFLELIDQYQFTYAVHSFDPRIVNQFKKQRKSVIRGQISSTFPKHNFLWSFCMKRLIFRFWNKPDFINFRISDLPRTQLDNLRKKGLLILSYTATSQQDLDFVRQRYDNAVFEGFIPKL